MSNKRICLVFEKTPLKDRQTDRHAQGTTDFTKQLRHRHAQIPFLPGMIKVHYLVVPQKPIWLACMHYMRSKFDHSCNRINKSQNVRPSSLHRTRAGNVNGKHYWLIRH